MSNEPVPSSPPPLRLFNHFTGVYPEGVQLWPKCYYTLPPEIHNYFFRHLFAGRRGIYQELTSAFYAKLYAECQRRGLVGERAVWDPSNEGVVAEILRDLNFRPEELRPTVPVTKRGSGKRRSAARPDVSPRQPEPGPRD